MSIMNDWQDWFSGTLYGNYRANQFVSLDIALHVYRAVYLQRVQYSQQSAFIRRNNSRVSSYIIIPLASMNS